MLVALRGHINPYPQYIHQSNALFRTRPPDFDIIVHSPKTNLVIREAEAKAKRKVRPFVVYRVLSFSFGLFGRHTWQRCSLTRFMFHVPCDYTLCLSSNSKWDSPECHSIWDTTTTTSLLSEPSVSHSIRKIKKTGCYRYTYAYKERVSDLRLQTGCHGNLRQVNKNTLIRRQSHSEIDVEGEFDGSS